MTQAVKKIKTLPNNPIFLIENENILVLERKDADHTISPVGLLPSQEFINQMQKTLPLDTGILPENCILYRRTENKAKIYHSMILQLPPKRYNLHFKFGQTDRRFNLPMPYLQYYFKVQEYSGLFSLANSRISATAKPISSIKDSVFMPPLANVYNDTYPGSICWGAVSVNNSQAKTLERFTKMLINNHLASEFNNDLRMGFKSFQNHSVPSEGLFTFLESQNDDFFLDEGKLKTYTYAKVVGDILNGIS